MPTLFSLVLVIIAVYFFLVFVGLRLIFPFAGFKKYLPPIEVPKEVEATIQVLQGQSHGQMSYLKAAYDFVQSRWHIERLKTVIKFPLAFRTDLSQIWAQPGFAHCTTQNFILYTLLARGGYFKPEDVRFKYPMVNFCLHQYMQVKIGDKWVNIDPANAGMVGLPMGSRGGFFS